MEKNEQGNMIIEPEINYDLTGLFDHITKNVLQQTTFFVSFGFKQSDYQTDDGFKSHLKSNIKNKTAVFERRGKVKGSSVQQPRSKVVTKKITLKEFIPMSHSLYKEIQVNTNSASYYNFGMIGFDIDKPYYQIKDQLASLIYDKKIPEPSYIIIRQNNQHAHVVYLLDKRYSKAFKNDRDYLLKVRNHFTKLLDSDKGYVNCWFHNPFYEYSFETKSYTHSNDTGYYLVKPPTIRTSFDMAYDDFHDYSDYENGSEVEPFDFKFYTLKQLNAYVDQYYAALTVADVDRLVAELYENGKPKKNRKEMLAEHERIYKEFPTGPNYRNNTLFYNSMCMAGRGVLTTERSILNYILDAYEYYETNYPDLEPMLIDELRSIANSVWRYLINGRIYITKLRAWNGSDYVSFSEIQRQRSNKAAELRKKQKSSQIKKLEKILLDIDFSDPLNCPYIDLAHFKHEMAKKFRCQPKTIERYLKEIKEEHERFLFYTTRKVLKLQDYQTLLKKQFLDNVGANSLINQPTCLRKMVQAADNAKANTVEAVKNESQYASKFIKDNQILNKTKQGCTSVGSVGFHVHLRI